MNRIASRDILKTTRLMSKTNHRKIIGLLIFLFTIVSNFAFAQQKNVIFSNDTINKPKAIAIVDVIQEFGKVNEELNLMEQKVAPPQDILKMDSLYLEFKGLYNQEKKRITEFISANPNRQKIETKSKKWIGYKNILRGWETNMNKYVEKNFQNLKTIEFEEETWKLTYKNAQEEGVPVDLLLTIEKINTRIKNLKKTISEHNNRYLRHGARTNSRISDIDAVLNSLENLKQSEVYDLFYLRHNPLWQSLSSTHEGKERRDEIESINTSLNGVFQLIKDKENNLFLFFILVIGMILIILYAKSSFLKFNNDDEKPLFKGYLKSILTERTIPIIVFSVLITANLFFLNTPRLFNDIIILGLLISSLPILKPIEHDRFKSIFYFLILFYVLDSIKSYAWFTSPQYRLYLLFQATVVLGTYYYFTRPYLITRKKINTDFAHLVLLLTPIIYISVIISILSNILGYTNLTDVTLNISTTIGILSMIFYTLFLISESLVFSFIYKHYSLLPNYSKESRHKLEKKVYHAIKVIVIIIWFLYFLNIIDQLKPISEYLEIALSDPYQIGEITFTLGAIVSFFSILTVAYLATSFISFIINDGDGEGVLRYFNFKKGVPSAISLVLRYVIFCFGFIFALSVLGIDLSTFNLMAGAVGLGIGFGLQTIISNFISGLILVFERPILPGDTVEVNNLFGTVNKIGIRASTISTYDGAEVIVPNNNLISKDLINWTLSSNFKRIEILIGTAYGSDPNKVLDILLAAAQNCKYTLKDPKSVALFRTFGDSSLNFSLRFWVYFENGLQAQSDVSIDIYNRFAEAGIQIPFPQRDVNLKGLSPGLGLDSKSIDSEN
jgi:small-conductance mechanosensitive channel